jgi:hypothetical protein
MSATPSLDSWTVRFTPKTYKEEIEGKGTEPKIRGLNLVLLPRGINKRTPEGCSGPTRVSREYGRFMLKNDKHSILLNSLYANRPHQSQPGIEQA